MFSFLFLTATAVAQQDNPTQDGTKKDPESKPAAKSLPAASVMTHEAEGITREQADAILSELRQIRQLLEKEQAQVSRALEPPAATPPSPQRVQIDVKSSWHSLGRADAPVTVVEFTDYECPYCKQFHSATFGELKHNYIDTGKVRWVAHDLPLEKHPLAENAAEAAHCAGDQGKFWELHDLLLSSEAPLDAGVIEKSAEGLALDVKDLQLCLKSRKYSAEVLRELAQATALQIIHTPTFVVAKSAKDKLDGVVILGAQPLATFQSAIDPLLKN
jgi:protein-disulfide isomerase